MEGRDTEEWARDSSVFFRLRDSVVVFVRGAGSFQDRANYAVRRLRPLRSADFPASLQFVWAEIEKLMQASIWVGPVSPMLLTGRLSPKQREAFTKSIFFLYEEMLKIRSGLK